VAAAIALLALFPVPARAAIPGVFVEMTGPNPNTVPAGSTVGLTAQYSIPSDLGPLTVSIHVNTPGIGTIGLDAANTTSELTGCVASVDSVDCSWDGEVADGPQTLAVLFEVGAGTAPFSFAQLAATLASVDDFDSYASWEILVTPPPGTTSLSGRAVTEGGAPVPGACVFVISSPLFIFPTIADSAGNWSISSLPDDYEYVVGVIPGFDIGDGPCVTDNGPPPVPGPGELQPVFHDDVWIDLADPQLTGGQGDPFQFAVAAGATVLTGSASGLEACLTTAPLEADPRPACVQSVVTTTPTTAAGTLPLTGGSTGPLAGLSVSLVAAGAALLAARRRSDPRD
jgi:hypothetical protein